ncbi:MAG TPA: molybdopterin-guanine dinucleotide biosynthesis protein MobB [Spirochaetales bacterium]|nr:molybdopterin-guanine dinucleotide biosynthesis protein MobB [Spirochaetales bacterium]HRZ64469.1 molybdopterin-guanine dinucleotide biosynthesis protein MobB [Spirochaetia bacterium]
MGDPLFVSVLGWSGSGKTSLVAAALAECARRGLPAAAAKRSHHEPDLAPGGKDSTAYLAAGALASLYVGDRGAVLFMPSPAATSRAFYARLFPEARIIFLEGDRVEGGLVVETGGPARAEAELKLPFAEIGLLVTAEPGLARACRDAGIEIIEPGEAARFIDLLEAYHGT